jgi:regulator of protease activity HflC (stomatin/prohibitin superfamily)
VDTGTGEIKISTIIKLVLGAVGVIFGLTLLFDSNVTVQSGHVGVVQTLGKVTGEMQPGFNWKMPLFQKVTVMNVQVQKEQDDASAATKDLQTVTAKVALNYHLDHGQVDNVFVNLSPQYADRIIDPTIQETVKAVTARYDAGDLLTYRAEIADHINSILISKFQPRGIVVDQVSIVNFSFSPQFTQAIEQKQAAQQAALQAQYTLDKAQKDAQSNQVQTAALTDAILEQQAIAKWNGVMPTTVSGGGSVFSIPVGK